jgi:chemotaxis protein histidine kinase CheA
MQGTIPPSPTRGLVALLHNVIHEPEAVQLHDRIGEQLSSGEITEDKAVEAFAESTAEVAQRLFNPQVHTKKGTPGARFNHRSWVQVVGDQEFVATWLQTEVDGLREDVSAGALPGEAEELFPMDDVPPGSSNGGAVDDSAVYYSALDGSEQPPQVNGAADQSASDAPDTTNVGDLMAPVSLFAAAGAEETADAKAAAEAKAADEKAAADAKAAAEAKAADEKAAADAKAAAEAKAADEKAAADAKAADAKAAAEAKAADEKAAADAKATYRRRVVLVSALAVATLAGLVWRFRPETGQDLQMLFQRAQKMSVRNKD